MKKLHLTAKKRRILYRIGLVVAAGLVLTWLLEYRYFINNAGLAWRFVGERPLVFLYNSLIMSLLIVIVGCIFRKPWTSVGVLCAVAIVFSYIHIAKFRLRGTPLLPEDFQLADQTATLTKFVDWGEIVRTIIAVILTLVLAALLNHLTAKFFLRPKGDEPKSWWHRHDVLPRALIALLAILGLISATDFVRHHGGQRYEDIPWLNTHFVAWNQVRNYDYNGFILGFLYNWNKFELKEPDGYSKDAIDQIAEKYLAKQLADSGRLPLAEADYNIVVVLNESFYDPSIIRDYYQYRGEITPVLRKLMKKYPSGEMYSLDYGGGTANIEFEVFTGLSNYWANTVPYTDLLPRAGAIHSIASYAKANGYQTTAIHPFNGGMYKRNIALKNEGFDTFITELEMDYTEHDGTSEYINDRSAYKQVLKVLKDSSKRQMIGLITMQNHTPYLPNPYEQTDFEITGGMEAEEVWRREEVAAYFQALHVSDQYLGEFIKSLEQSDEKTVVLFFGDHSAGMFPDVNEHEEQAVRDLGRKMPYFIYTNFELAQQKLPTTTPNCLVNTFYNVMKLEKPTLNYLLDTVCTETPILTHFYLGDKDTPQYVALYEYELINYDILGGKKWWYQATD